MINSRASKTHVIYKELRCGETHGKFFTEDLDEVTCNLCLCNMFRYKFGHLLRYKIIKRR